MEKKCSVDNLRKDAPGGWGLVLETPVLEPSRRGLEYETPATPIH